MQIRKDTVVAATIGICLLSSGCASIVSKSRYAVTIDNATAPTYFSIQNRKNETIHQGVTPQQVTLDAKSFPFWPAKYDIVFAGHESHTQRREVKAEFDPWIAGNLLIGGGAGAIVDGATGAMFKLPTRVQGEVPPPYAVTDPNLGFQVVQSRLQSDRIAVGSAESSVEIASTPPASEPAAKVAVQPAAQVAAQPAARVATR